MTAFRTTMVLLAGTAAVLGGCSAERAGTVVQNDADSPLACATAMGETLADVRGWLGIAADGSGDTTVNVIDLRDKAENTLFLMTAGPDLVCGSPFDDTIDSAHRTTQIQTLVAKGDLLLGGTGNDWAFAMFGGVFHGGEGDDAVDHIGEGTFDGGPGNDTVRESIRNGRFLGGDGDDTAKLLWGGPYDGGEGNDTVTSYVVGATISVEQCTAAEGYECP